MQQLSEGTLLQGGKYKIEKMLLHPLKRFRGRISCLQKAKRGDIYTYRATRLGCSICVKYFL